MTKGLFEYPTKAAFGRIIPKAKVFAFGKTTRRLRDLFTTEIDTITWRFKLAPGTINLPAGPDVAEIQIFGIELKPGIQDISLEILRCIDTAIAFPIFFEVVSRSTAGLRVKVIAAYKRPSESDSSKWVVCDYVGTDWLPAETLRSPLPVALNMSGLYDQMLRQLLPIASEPGESLKALTERHQTLAMKLRELTKLEAQLKRENHYNRKVEINAHLRRVRTEIADLSGESKL